MISFNSYYERSKTQSVGVSGDWKCSNCQMQDLENDEPLIARRQIQCPRVCFIQPRYSDKILRFSGARNHCFLLKMYPAKLKSRSRSADVAGTHCIHFTMFS